MRSPDRMAGVTRTLLVSLALLAVTTFAAKAQTFSAEVRKFIRYDDALIALAHVTVIDGTGAPARRDETVLLRNGRIEAVGDAAMQLPAGARVLDLTGHTVLPGFVGMHNHLMYTASINLDDEGRIPPPGFFVTEIAFSAPRLYLAAGVTTMRTTGSVEPYTDLNIRRQIDELQIPGPHIDVSGPYLEGTDSFFPQMPNLSVPEQARSTVAFWAAQGVTSSKAYMKITEAVLAAAIDESHRHGLKITGHLCAVDYRRAAALGIDNLEHGPVFTDSEFVPGRRADVCPSAADIAASWENLEIDSEPVQAMIRDLVAHNVAITSTLPVFESFVPTRPLLSKRQMDMMSSESLRSHLNARALAGAAPQRAARLEAALKKEMAFEIAFVRAGGLLMTGPDPTGNGGVLPGFGDLRGIELLVEAGFAPVEAIRIATSNGARYLGRTERIGTIQAGKQADVVVVRGDPATRIADIENTEIVFKDGIGYDPAKLIASVRGMVGTR